MLASKLDNLRAKFAVAKRRKSKPMETDGEAGE